MQICELNKEFDFQQYQQNLLDQLAIRLKINSKQTTILLNDFLKTLNVKLYQPFYIKGGPVWSTNHAKFYHSNIWIKSLKPDGESSPLLTTHIINHFLGKYWIGAARGSQVDFFVIDIDAHSDKDKETLQERYIAVRKALRNAPCITIRTRGGGLHLYYFLDKKMSKYNLRNQIILKLENKGIVCAPGQIEIYPTNSNFSLPLGRKSCLLTDSLDPVSAKYLDNGSIKRDLNIDINSFINLSKKLRSPLSRYIGINKNKQNLKMLNVANTVDIYSKKSTKNPDEAPIWGNGITEYGRRFEQSKSFLLFHYNKHIQNNEILNKFEIWLRTKKHKSKDLERDKNKTVSHALSWASKYLSVLDQYKQEDKFKSKVSISDKDKTEDLHPDFRYGSLLIYIYIVHTISKFPKYWRYFAYSCLLEEDKLLLSKIEDIWLRKRYKLLIGILRVGYNKYGYRDTVQMSCAALEQICGHKRAPDRFRVKDSIIPTAVKAFLADAVNRGWLEFEGHGSYFYVKLYRVKIPGLLPSDFNKQI